MRANVCLRKHILLRFTAFKLYLTQRGTKLLTFYFVENLLLLKNDNICVKHRVLNDLAFSFCRFPSLYLQLNFLFLWVPLCMLSLSMFISFFLLQIFLNCNILDNLFTFSFFLSFFFFLQISTYGFMMVSGEMSFFRLNSINISSEIWWRSFNRKEFTEKIRLRFKLLKPLLLVKTSEWMTPSYAKSISMIIPSLQTIL